MAIITDLVFVAIGDVRADPDNPIQSIQGLQRPLGGAVEDLPAIALIVQAGGGETRPLPPTFLAYSLRPGEGWWRRWESNPRPKAFNSRIYMLVQFQKSVR